MFTDWFRTIELQITWDQFLQLPRHSAYKYEYSDGTAYLTPRPRFVRVRLDLKEEHPICSEICGLGSRISIDPLLEQDWRHVSGLLCEAFARIPPFGVLDDSERNQAGEDCIMYTKSGRDGPVVGSACHVARDVELPERPIGIILITLVPKREVNESAALQWHEPPPSDCIERCLGRPHLTWIAVHPFYSRHGIGSVMLISAIRSLRELGYDELTSTLMLGNDYSLAWHWRNGFRLLSRPMSIR